MALIEHGATVDARNRLEDTPLMLAAANGNFSTCVLLLKHRADI
jgi:ankyrin repeat protein